MANSIKDRFINELSTQCNTPGKACAAALIAEKFSRSSARTRNRLLLALLSGYMHRHEAAWCLALLRVLLYPMLQRALAHYPEFTWIEVQSAFYCAVEEYPHHRRKYAMLTFRTVFLEALFQENTQELKAQQLAEGLQAELRSHSLDDVLGRDEARGLTKAEAKQALAHWSCLGLVSVKNARYVIGRLFPARIARSDAERQRASRSFRKTRDLLKTIFRKP